MMRGMTWFGILLGALAGCGCTVQYESSGEAEKTNFVILFADDLGYGDLESYGHPLIRTPELERMAAGGVRLTSFYTAASVCTPSRAGLLTGRYPPRCGQPGNLGPSSEGGLPPTERTTADYLKDLGYRTKAIGKWHLGHSSPEYMPTGRGFDSYFGLRYSNDMIPPWVQTEAPLFLYRDLEPVARDEVDQDQLTVRYTEEALKFLEESRQQPFFLYLAYSMPHLPVRTAERFRGSSEAGLYGDVIQAIDWSVGRILDSLEVDGVIDRTMVVFTSDNGPWHNLPARMLQAGNEPWHTGTAGLLRGAKGTTWEGGFRVPGIIHWPDQIEAGRVSSEMVSTLDLLPTIVSAAGGSLLQDRVYDGSDLGPFLRGEAPSPRDEFYFFRGNRLEAVRSEKWKYRYATYDVHGEGARDADPLLRSRLYSLDVDPGERYDVADRHPDVAERLHERMIQFAEEVGAEVEE